MAHSRWRCFHTVRDESLDKLMCMKMMAITVTKSQEHCFRGAAPGFTTLQWLFILAFSQMFHPFVNFFWKHYNWSCLFTKMNLKKNKKNCMRQHHTVFSTLDVSDLMRRISPESQILCGLFKDVLRSASKLIESTPKNACSAKDISTCLQKIRRVDGNMISLI